MPGSRSSSLGALDAFFDVVRRKADQDAEFGAELVKALEIPIEIQINSPADVASNLLHLDPFVFAGKGLDEFRQIYSKLKDAELKKIIKAYNLAPAESLTGKGSPKGQALITLMWDAAKAQRDRMERRA